MAPRPGPIGPGAGGCVRSVNGCGGRGGVALLNTKAGGVYETPRAGVNDGFLIDARPGRRAQTARPREDAQITVIASGGGDRRAGEATPPPFRICPRRTPPP